MTHHWRDRGLFFSHAGPEVLEALANKLARERVCAHMHFGPNTPAETRATFRPLIAAQQAALARGEAPVDHVFAVREGEVFVGQGALLSLAPGHFELGYQLDDPFWGRGLGTRVCAFLVRHAFDRLGARRLSAECLASNLASARILERCGFTSPWIKSPRHLAWSFRRWRRYVP